MKQVYVDPDDEISIRELLIKFRYWKTFVLSKLKVIIFVGMIGALAAGLYAYLKKPFYTAELNFVIEGDNTSGAANYASIASQFGFNLGGNTSSQIFSGRNISALMSSRAMIEKTLLATVDIDGRATTLAEHYIDINELRDDWEDMPQYRDVHFLPGADRSTFSLAQNKLLFSFFKAIVEDNLKVETESKSASIISLTLNSEDELFSKLFAEKLTETVSAFYIESKTKKAAINLAILQHQTDSVKNAFNNAITSVANLAEANPNPNPALQRLRTPAQKKQIDVTINQAILSELVKNLEVAKNSLRNETPLIQVIDQPVLPLPMLRKSLVMYGILGFIAVAGLTGLFLIIDRFLKDITKEDNEQPFNQMP